MLFSRRRTRLWAVAAGALLGCTPTLLWLAMPSGGSLHLKLLKAIAGAFAAGPQNVLATAIGGVGIALLLVGAFGDRTEGYETLLENQLEVALKTFVFITSALLVMASLELSVGFPRNAVGFLLTASISGLIAASLLLAPRLLAIWLPSIHASTASRVLLGCAGIVALGAAIGRISFNL